MFKDYIYFGHQTAAVSSQLRIGVDLTQVTAWHRNPGQNSVTVFMRPSASHVVYMTQAEFDEFLVNLKTANRLKKAYE